MTVDKDDKASVKHIATDRLDGDVWIVTGGVADRRSDHRLRPAADAPRRCGKGDALAAASGKGYGERCTGPVAPGPSCMPQFFIDRPIFAWVIAILITLAGFICLRELGVESYPQIAPPQVVVSATFAGASADTVEKTVTQVIEQQLNGIDHLLYFSSTSSSNGSATITLTFDTGTNPDIAQVQTQNRVSLALPRLPAEVTAQGVTVAKANPGFLMVIAVKSEDGAQDSYALNNIIASRLLDPLQRIPGSAARPSSAPNMRCASG